MRFGIFAREKEDALKYLTQFFKKRPHQNTFWAIEKRAKGVDLDSLKRIVTRLRFRKPLTPERDPVLTSDVVLLVCLERKDYPAEHMILGEWFDEWLQLPDDIINYHSFSAYIEEKILNREAELLDEGLRIWAYDEEYAEPCDRFDWHRSVSDSETELQNNLRIITPYDERPGDIVIRNFDPVVWFNYWIDKYNKRKRKGRERWQVRFYCQPKDVS